MHFFIQQAVFTDFRPVFIVMIGILIVFFILALIQGGQNRGVSFSLILTVSLTQLLVAGSLFLIESNMVDDYGLTPDRLTLYLFIAIVVLGILNPIVFKLRNRNSSRSTYRYRGY